MDDYAHKERPPLDEVVGWLEDHHGGPVESVKPLRGGYWSSAWSYRADSRDLVLRLGADDAGYRIDQRAGSFGAVGVPVPKVHHIGTALGRAAAISDRRFGTFLEEQPLDTADATGHALADLFAAMRRVRGHDRSEWYLPHGRASWHDWLLHQLERTDAVEVNWATACARHPSLDATFAAARSKILEAIERLPERRDLVHGDLLHQNVLVEDSRVTGVFSWKCSAFGDFLFDVAWCSVWSSWFPVIDAVDMWGRTQVAPDLTAVDLHDAEARHAIYQLHISCTHLLWFVQSSDDGNLERLLGQTMGLLDQ